MHLSLRIASIIALLFSSCSAMVRFQVKNNPQNFKQVIDESIFNFGLNLNKLLVQHADQGENVIFSPIGIYASLALTHLGSNGETRKEIGNVMGLPSDSEITYKLHENLGDMFKNLQIGVNANVSFANGIFLQNGLQLKTSFQNQLKSYYNNQYVNVDFNSQDVIEKINSWFSVHTHDKIQHFFEEGIPHDTRLLLANALCFCSDWDQVFPTETTQQETFETGTGDHESINMMHKTDTVPYYYNQEYHFESVAIPYKQSEYLMYVILPQEGQTLKNLSDIFTYQQIQQIINESTSTVVDIKVPQIKIKTSDKIKQILQQLGLNQLFETPDLSNMIDQSNLKLSQVSYSLEIQVDEQGTDVCAGTAQQYKVHDQQVQFVDAQKQFYLQKPFMFFVYHPATKCVLFYGNVYQLSQ
ncbi:leukocyte elastase inhibitor-like [Planococcus citri]|uniref:leukocyte elastase inhibitor-like n=1 Tax=Planococcus citri TaxID=170843 RepID=UPI0031F86FE2